MLQKIIYLAAYSGQTHIHMVKCITESLEWKVIRLHSGVLLTAACRPLNCNWISVFLLSNNIVTFTESHPPPLNLQQQRMTPLLLTYFTLKNCCSNAKKCRHMTLNATECISIPQKMIYLAAYSVHIHVQMVGYITEPLTWQRYTVVYYSPQLVDTACGYSGTFSMYYLN